MTATTSSTTPAVVRASHQTVPDARLRFSGILRSEWIKLTTLRSTIWAYGILIVLQVAMGVLLTLTQDEMRMAAQDPSQTAVFISTLGIMFNQLVISVLGVLVISGEYGTGQIRSSLTAVPKRLPVLWAKALVFAVTSFVVGLVAVLATYFVTWPMLNARGVASDITDVDLWAHLVGGAGYLALIGLLAFFIGALLRHTAGGIAAAVGLLLVAPTVLSFIVADWATVLGQWLPGSAGQTLFFGSEIFEPWQALLVMLGWIAVFATAAAVLFKRRDA